MIEKNYQKVYSVNGTLQAANIQAELERAGIPVTVAHGKDGAYLDVLVPVAKVQDAHQLLFPERRGGEINFAPAG